MVRHRLFLSIFFVTTVLHAQKCELKLFTVTLDKSLMISDVLDNLVHSCGLNIVLKDSIVKKKILQKLHYIRLKDATLVNLLDTVLKDNNIHYILNGKKLEVSYLLTKTFRVNYVAGSRVGKSNAHIQVANAGKMMQQQKKVDATADSSGSGLRTGMSIQSNDEFKFWQTIQSELARILIGATDGEVLYTKRGDSWVDKEDRQWGYNPLTPIVNPEAGMITVTGNIRQLARVSRYIQTLTEQIKQQVLIDVRILSVTFDHSNTMGVDWSKIYSLQNITVNAAKIIENNLSFTNGVYTTNEGASSFQISQDDTPSTSSALLLNGHASISGIVQFLGTQGNVKSISSPRVMTLNNQPALISVGKEIFYKTTTATTTSGNGGAVAIQGEQIGSVFSGILLDITPQISPSGYITLKINPSISEELDVTKVGEDGVRFMPPDLIRRQIASVVKMENGHSAILGGLISSKNGIKSNKVPLLGEIPIVGTLFSRDQKIDITEELVLIITPHIVDHQKSISLRKLGYRKINDK